MLSHSRKKEVQEKEAQLRRGEGGIFLVKIKVKTEDGRGKILPELCQDGVGGRVGGSQGRQEQDQQEVQEVRGRHAGGD